MRAALIAPFVLSARLDLAALLHSDPREVKRRLAAAELVGWQVLGDQSETSSALIHEHEPIGATLAPRRLLSARGVLASPSGQPLSGVEQAELCLGVHGTGCLVLWVDPVGELTELENEACHLVAPLAGLLNEFLSDHAGGLIDRNTSGRYPVNTFLWWHRVLHPSSDAEAADARRRLSGSQRTDTAAGGELAVGDGWTVLTGGDDEDLAAVVRGIVDAQEIWTACETASRDVVLQLAALQADGVTAWDTLRGIEAEAIRVAESEQLRAAVLQDQVRYTTGLRRESVVLASQAWRMSLALEPVATHLASLQTVLARRIDLQREAQARRLEGALFALGVLTSFGLALAIFETAVGPPEEAHPGRVAAAVLVGLAALLGAWLALHLYRRRMP